MRILGIAFGLFLILSLSSIRGYQTKVVQLGDITICNSSVLYHLKNRPFSSQQWKEVNSTIRGQMILDLAQQNILANKKSSQIITMLGEPKCYMNYDGEPCYRISINKGHYVLAFPVNHSGSKAGKVNGPYLRKRSSDLFGCLGI